MGNQQLPSGREFALRFIMVVSVCGIITALAVIAYLFVLLRMSGEQMAGLATIVGVLALIATPIDAYLYRRAITPIIHWLDAVRAGNASHEDERRAFETVANLPRRVLVLGFLFFAVPAALSITVMFLFFEDFGLYNATLMMVAILSGALLSAIVEGFLLKRWLNPLRVALTLAIQNPMERSELTQPISLMLKLQVVITACTLVPVIFVGLVGQTRTSIPVEGLVHALHREILAESLERAALNPEVELTDIVEQFRSGALSASLAILDLEDGSVASAGRDVLTPAEWAAIRESGEAAGVGKELGSENLYTWVPTNDARFALVAASPRAVIVGSNSGMLPIFLGLVFGCAILALGISWLVAQEVGGATRRLGHAADRMAAGDLRRSDVFESEDELGTLGRAFDAMASSLRRSVGDVAKTADGIDAAAGDIKRVSEELLTAAVGQGRDVKQMVSAMGEVESQVTEIARSSNELKHLVEESTSSVLELGSAGEQLDQTASVLGERVEEVLTSVEQTIRSVKEVGRETESLSDAAAETSSSMEEMASAMRRVDVTAAETAALSEQVVRASELGLGKVRATIDGIESIRTATEKAQSVILSLGGRAQEIGSILDVIDDVADETNLLALNAAIIAAQAGEQGRAFSVVADEIKELADRVLASTKEISGLIRSVQEESQSAIEAMEEGSASVAEGVLRSSEAGESLDEITRISRDSGLRILEIVASVQEQTKAAGGVVELMDRVREGVSAIQYAASEQEKGNQVVFESTKSMRDVAIQLKSTTAEQAKGLGQIRESVGGVQAAVEVIDGALQGQSASCSQVVGFLEEVSSRSMANETSAHQMGESTQELLAQALKLRAGMGRFQR